jgi:hypothetical protein
MPSPDDESLIEAAAAAYRARDPHGAIAFHPAWWDLDDSGRQAAFTATVQSRALESALASDGLSSTARAVLARIRGGPQPRPPTSSR